MSKVKVMDERVDEIFKHCSDDVIRNRHSNYYEVNVLNSTTIELQCFLNYHWLSGSQYRHCYPDGNWTGEEMLCEVDYFKERYRLSGSIILLTAALAFVYLGIDFSKYLNKRVEIRRYKRRLSMWKLKETFQYSDIPSEHLFRTNAKRLTFLNLTPNDGEEYDKRFSSSDILFKKASSMGAFGYHGTPRGNPQAPTPKLSTVPNNSKIKNIERGMFLFRMKNKAFVHTDS